MVFHVVSLGNRYFRSSVFPHVLPPVWREETNISSVKQNLKSRLLITLKPRVSRLPAASAVFPERNSKAWAASIILIIPAFIITYLLSKDLLVHERSQDAFLASAFPERMFMPQTIPIKTYVLITIVTLGVGGIYWLYKVVNLYNAHFKAHVQVEKEIAG